jgi:polyisoprenoid-binding protein YceI
MTTSKRAIDPAHSRVTFRGKHLMISNVEGEFKNFSGNINFDSDKPADTSLEISIDAESIDTHVSDRDNHLRSADFLNIEEYPEITFKSTSVEIIGENTAKLHGDLTIRSKSKAISLDVDMNCVAQSSWGQPVAGFSSSIKINREDWGLTWNQALETGGFLVGKEIKIGIELELIKETDPELAATAN